VKTWAYLWNHPLQRRISLLTTVAVAVAVVLFSLVGYVMMRTTLVQTSQEVALSIANDLAAPATRDLEATGVLSPDLHQAGKVVVEAVDGQGRALRLPGEQRELVLEPGDVAAAGAGGSTTRRTGVAVDGEPYAVVVVPLPGTGHALVVGRSLAPVLAILGVQRLILLVISIAGILAAGVVGVLVGRSGLRPMRQLTEAVEHVTETQDLQPVSVPYARGDLAVLASSFNLMLASLTTARDRTSRLVADAGHELRTPLTSLRTNVDLLAADVRRDQLSVEAKALVIEDLRGQLGELSDMIGDLVHVARDDTALTLAPLDVRDVVPWARRRTRSSSWPTRTRSGAP
jgi:two-component system sensor histidine kinase MprB